MKHKTVFYPILILSLILALTISFFSLSTASGARLDMPALMDTWTARASMPTARPYLGVAAAANGKLYAMGGYNGNVLSTVEEYDPATNTWVARANMPTARYDLGVVAAANGKLYAIGGTTGPAYFATVEEYNPVTDTWTARANMPTARYGLGVAAASNGKLYAMGGYNPSFGGDLSTVEEYDPATNTWTARANMPTARYDFGVAASNGKLYAIGGYNHTSGDLSMVEEYNPVTDTWTARANMPTARHGLSVAAASNGKLYAIGGYSLSIGGDLSMVEEYNPATNTWVARANMPTARSDFGVAPAANGKLYAIGGRAGNNWLSTVEEYDPPATNTPCFTLNARDFQGVLVTASTTDYYQWFTWAGDSSPDVNTYAEATWDNTSVRTDIYPQVSIQASVLSGAYRVWVYQLGNEGDQSLETTVGTDAPVRTDGTTWLWVDVGTHAVRADTLIMIKAVGAFVDHGQGVPERRGGFKSVYLTTDLSTTPPTSVPDGQSSISCGITPPPPPTDTTTISGQVYNDLNGDGAQSASESGVANWTVQLVNPATSTVIATKQTDASGNYSFANLDAGTYQVREVLKNQYVQTTPNPAPITALSGVDVPNQNFGVVKPLDLQVAVVQTNTQQWVGTPMTYTINAYNNGPAAAQNMTLTDAIPVSTTFLSYTAPAGWSCTTTGALMCTNPSMAQGKVVFTLTVLVDPNVANTSKIPDTATVASAVFDTKPVNNSYTVSRLVYNQSDVSIQQVADALGGAVVRYSFTIQNAGPNTAKSVNLTDALAATTQVVSATASQGICTLGQKVTCSLGDVTVGSTVTVTIMVNVTGQPASITNTGKITTATVDPHPTDKAATAVVTGPF